MEEKAETESSTIVELEKLVSTISDEKRQRIFYVLDYILHYFTGERRIPKLSELGFGSEVIQLKNVGVIKETSLYCKGHNYSHLYIEKEIQEKIRNLLKEKYYPLFDETKITETIRKITKESLTAASRLWHKVEEFDSVQYTLSGYGEYETEVSRLGEELAKNGLAYLIGYWSTSWTEYCDDFIFRKEPFHVRTIFLKIVEEEVSEVFTSFTPEIRWCLYLKFIEPNANEEFMLRNATNRFLPSEVKRAFSRIPILKVEKFKPIIETLLTKEKERLSHVLRTLVNRDSISVFGLSTLFLLSQEKERYLQIGKWSFDKIKEISTSTYETLCGYVKIFKDFGMILESNYGDLIIPKILTDVFNEEIKGGAVEVKIFESELDAQSFIEEVMSKAISNVKIWDPYVSTRTLRIIEKCIKPNTIQVEILSSQPPILDEVLTLIRQGMKINAKIIYQKRGEKYLSPFHDRYLIIDELYVWHFGPSLHAAGEKGWESATLFSESFGKIVIQAFKYNFERENEDWKKDGYEVIDKDFTS